MHCNTAHTPTSTQSCLLTQTHTQGDACTYIAYGAKMQWRIYEYCDPIIFQL